MLLVYVNFVLKVKFFKVKFHPFNMLSNNMTEEKDKLEISYISQTDNWCKKVKKEIIVCF